jgi:nitrite reductase/ring-hydroxylating ferredoxin subunit
VTNAWRSYRSAPAIGTVICSADAVPDLGTKTVILESDRGSFPVILLRNGEAIRGFVNACPHQFLHLDYRSQSLLSADARIIRCSSHSAGFCATTGAGVEGLGIGVHLDPVPVGIDRSGQIIILGDGDES